MKQKMRVAYVSQIIDLSTHLRRIIVCGDSLEDFPVWLEGAHVKVVLPTYIETERTMRSYTIRFFNHKTKALALDFVVNRHQGPATCWASGAKVGDSIGIAGPGQIKLTDFNHHSYLLIGDLTSVNAINGFVPRFNDQADIRVIIAVPTRADIIAMDYDDSNNTCWYIEDEAKLSLTEQVMASAKGLAVDARVFMGLEAGHIRALRPVLQEDLGLNRVNIFAVGYWKQGVDADRFGAQKKANPL
ncbi:siderophore-interacting protein [Shewanella aestuarii]|uniref:Siderophore-interacting protein n=1 Tax=Shewanella aestuarii TaxID=1028752 RepID=A0A6G9QQB1_9GAMM|nr:siderophore-interacting protein [Shewanella aestuarii]